MRQTNREAELAGWIAEFTPRLLPVARAFARGPEEAEDILQETWLVALKTAHQRSSGSPIGAWLCRVTLNLGRMRMRKRKRRESLFARSMAVGDLSDGTTPPELGAEQLRLRLWRYIGELPDLQQEVVMLRLVEGMNTLESAEALGRAEGTVKSSLHRALRTLRRRLQLARGDTVERVDECAG